MKILILGNSASQWQRAFVDRVILPLGHDVYELASRDTNLHQEFSNNKDILIRPSRISQVIMKIPKIRALAMLCSNIMALRKTGPYDVIISMFVSNSSLYCARALKKSHTKLIAYFCGSDVLRLEGYKLAAMKRNVRHIDHLFFASEQVKDAYVQKFGHHVETVNAVIHLGISVFDAIDRLKEKKADCKTTLQIPVDRRSVCVGYNGKPAQQHISIIEKLSKSTEDEKKRLHLLFPMTYGATESYIRSIEDRVKREGFSYSIWRDYLNDEQMAVLHGATDFFINAQETDGLSASVLETLYAGSILLNAGWLDYPEYHTWGLSYAVFHDFDELLELIRRAVNGETVIDKERNHQILQGQMSWESTKVAWAHILEDIRCK